MRRYGELYAQTRLEALDCLDRMPELVKHEDLKSKLLFSVIVVSISILYSVLLFTVVSSQLSFRSVAATVSTKREQVRRVLQLPTASPAPGPLEPAARELEQALTAFLRRATDTFDLTKNVEVRKTVAPVEPVQPHPWPRFPVLRPGVAAVQCGFPELQTGPGGDCEIE